MTNRKKKTAVAASAAPGSAADLRALISLWEGREGQSWRKSSGLCLEAGRKALEFGHPTLAYEILALGLAAFPKNRGLQYCAALALVRAGSYDKAEELLKNSLKGLATRDPLYSEASSLQGRIAKDRWAKLPEGAARTALGEKSAAAYEAAYRASGDYFPGINAATLNLLTGHHRKSQRLAREVHELCLRRVQRTRKPDHWLLATLGEASLLLADPEEAAGWYTRAATAARGRAGDIASMRRQLKLLEQALELDPTLLQILAMPRVAVFTGHMIDHAGRSPERFPERMETTVARAIASSLAEHNVGFGYCSAACGADILFIEQMLAREAEVHVVLPFNRKDFVATSVAFAGARWVRRFERALAKATSVSYAVNEKYLGDDVLFEYTGALTQGAALLRARQLETQAMLLAVCDPEGEEGPGGTASTLAHWRRLGLPQHEIDLRSLRRESRIADAAAATPSRLESSAPNTAAVREIKTMLFADMVGFSKLAEEDTPAFLVHFLGAVAEVIAASPERPAFWNTWGDGLFLVFDRVAAAAEFALRLRDAVRRTDWRARGLPPDTNIRIGMHTGPVFPARDPIIDRGNYFGTHVNRAARIEPVTVPGAVYISEQMASLLAASGVVGLACDYLGRLPLAKGFGASALYRLRRSQETE